MIEYTKAIKRFRAELREVDFDARKPNPQLAWSAFKTCAYEPVNCIRESLLVELGNFYPGENLFHLTLLREFWAMEYDEEYCEQLQCDFQCSPDESLPDEQTYLWSHDFESLEEYFAAVESLDSFMAAMRHPIEKWRVEVGQWMA